MATLQETVAAMELDQQNEVDLFEAMNSTPQMAKLSAEIGQDAELAECALLWVREKKRQIVLNKMHVLLGEERFKEYLAKAQE